MNYLWYIYSSWSCFVTIFFLILPFVQIEKNMRNVRWITVYWNWLEKHSNYLNFMIRMFYLFKYMVISKIMITKQLKEECMCHKQLVEHLIKDPDCQQLTTNKLNQILHQTSELSAEYILRRINRKLMMRIHLSTKLYHLPIWIEVKQNMKKHS